MELALGSVFVRCIKLEVGSDVSSNISLRK